MYKNKSESQLVPQPIKIANTPQVERATHLAVGRVKCMSAGFLSSFKKMMYLEIQNIESYNYLKTFNYRKLQKIAKHCHIPANTKMTFILEELSKIPGIIGEVKCHFLHLEMRGQKTLKYLPNRKVNSDHTTAYTIVEGSVVQQEATYIEPIPVKNDSRIQPRMAAHFSQQQDLNYKTTIQSGKNEMNLRNMGPYTQPTPFNSSRQQSSTTRRELNYEMQFQPNTPGRNSLKMTRRVESTAHSSIQNRQPKRHIIPAQQQRMGYSRQPNSYGYEFSHNNQKKETSQKYYTQRQISKYQHRNVAHKVNQQMHFSATSTPTPNFRVDQRLSYWSIEQSTTPSLTPNFDDVSSVASEAPNSMMTTIEDLDKELLDYQLYPSENGGLPEFVYFGK